MINVNGTTVDKVIFEGVDLDIVNCNNVEVFRKNYTLSFIAGDNIIGFTHDTLSVPYESILSFNSNTIIITYPNGNSVSNEAIMASGAEFENWSGYNTKVVSNQTITATAKKEEIKNYTVTFTASNGTINRNSITVPSGTTYSTDGNNFNIDGQTITYSPTADDTYYDYGDTASWSSTQGQVTSNITISATTSKTEKSYSTKLSWGQNNPQVNPEEIHGWDNGDDDGNINLDLLADHTYVLHREDSAGTSVSYLGLVNSDNSHTIIETFTVLTDNIFIGTSGFYYGDVVNDNEPSNLLCADITEKTTTSINYTFKPGDYIRDNGGTSIQINVHYKQSCCWHTLRSGSWVRTRITNSAGKSVTGPSSRTSDTFIWNLDGVIANRPVYMYIGFGSALSTTTTGHATDSKPWDWIGDGGCSWTITGENTNQIVTYYNSGSRVTLLYTWWRWVFQRLY